MTVPHLAPGENYDIEGVHIESVLDHGEARIVTTVDGWKRREIDVEVYGAGGHIDGIEYEDQIPPEELQVVFGAVAKMVRLINPDVITVEDPNGNLL